MDGRRKSQGLSPSDSSHFGSRDGEHRGGLSEADPPVGVSCHCGSLGRIGRRIIPRGNEQGGGTVV